MKDKDKAKKDDPPEEMTEEERIAATAEAVNHENKKASQQLQSIEEVTE